MLSANQLARWLQVPDTTLGQLEITLGKAGRQQGPSDNSEAGGHLGPSATGLGLTGQQGARERLSDCPVQARLSTGRMTSGHSRGT